MKYGLIVVFGFVLTLPVMAQFNLKSTKTGRIREMKFGGYTLSITDSSGYKSYQGDLLGLDIAPDSSWVFRMKVRKYTAQTDHRDSVQRYQTLTYLGAQHEHVSIPIAEIDWISAQPGVANEISAVLLVVGIAATVYAPLTAINYRTGDFNQDTYYTVAGAGLVVTGVGLIVGAIAQKRTFKLGKDWTVVLGVR
jgi:hypothetical protein